MERKIISLSSNNLYSQKKSLSPQNDSTTFMDKALLFPPEGALISDDLITKLRILRSD